MGFHDDPVTQEAALAAALDDALPQTQCKRCGFPDCRAYADAIAFDAAAINRCPPGGHEGIVRLAARTGRPPLPLEPANGVEGPRLRAEIAEAACIGCTLCIQACPVDCIVGAPKRMHTVVEAQCTGCELCVPACPVDCIVLVAVTGQRTGWQAWSRDQADAARRRYRFRGARLEADAARDAERLSAASPTRQDDDTARPLRSAVVEAALARARSARAG